MAELERMIAGASTDQLPRGSGRAVASLQRSKTAPVLRERAASGGAGDVAAAPVTPPQEGASSPERGHAPDARALAGAGGHARTTGRFHVAGLSQRP